MAEVLYYFDTKATSNWTDSAYMICLDLAGIEPGQIELQVDGQVLCLAGHRPTPAPESGKQARIHIMEIDHGLFRRSIQIPTDVNTDAISARHHNGLVWIDMPKKTP